jgi:hypothetical protein
MEGTAEECKTACEAKDGCLGFMHHNFGFCEFTTHCKDGTFPTCAECQMFMGPATEASVRTWYGCKGADALESLAAPAPCPAPAVTHEDGTPAEPGSTDHAATNGHDDHAPSPATNGDHGAGEDAYGVPPECAAWEEPVDGSCGKKLEDNTDDSRLRMEGTVEECKTACATDETCLGFMHHNFGFCELATDCKDGIFSSCSECRKAKGPITADSVRWWFGKKSLPGCTEATEATASSPADAAPGAAPAPGDAPAPQAVADGVQPIPLPGLLIVAAATFITLDLSKEISLY